MHGWPPFSYGAPHIGPCSWEQGWLQPSRGGLSCRWHWHHENGQDHLFDQLSLALVFAGNALVVLGVAGTFRRAPEISTLVITHAIVCAVVYPFFPNSIYRFVAPTALAALLTVWIIYEKVFVFLHALIVAETISCRRIALNEETQRDIDSAGLLSCYYAAGDPSLYESHPDKPMGDRLQYTQDIPLAIEHRAGCGADLPLFPSGWRMEAISSSLC